MLLLHVPPVVTLANVIELFTHTDVTPVIAEGSALTVAIAIVLQPALKAYVIVVVPAATPVARPVDVMVAIAGLLLLHVPPVDASVSVLPKPIHKLRLPAIADTEPTFTVVVLAQPVVLSV